MGGQSKLGIGIIEVTEWWCEVRRKDVRANVGKLPTVQGNGFSFSLSSSPNYWSHSIWKEGKERWKSIIDYARVGLCIGKRKTRSWRRYPHTHTVGNSPLPSAALMPKWLYNNQGRTLMVTLAVVISIWSAVQQGKRFEAFRLVWRFRGTQVPKGDYCLF